MFDLNKYICYKPSNLTSSENNSTNKKVHFDITSTFNLVLQIILQLLEIEMYTVHHLEVILIFQNSQKRKSNLISLWKMCIICIKILFSEEYLTLPRTSEQKKSEQFLNNQVLLTSTTVL